VRPLGLDELVAIDAYEALREAYRARVMALKQERRLAVGERTTLVFENRETIRFQVQEMMRVERLREPARVQHELDVYNELVPGGDELSATLFIEIPDRTRIREELDRLLGIDACVHLELGGGEDALRVRARFDERQLEEERISAVHYLRFALPPEARAALGDPARAARIQIDHPRYRHAAALPSALRAALVADLAGDPEPLLRPAPGTAVRAASGAAGAAARPAPGARVRVRAAERAAGAGHVVVEPVEPLPSLLDADPALEAELLAAVKEQARIVLRDHGACRVSCDLHDPRPRWHVFAPMD